jgi:peroxiredoxin
MLDPDAVRREAERLYEEVIADYADIPYYHVPIFRDRPRQAPEAEPKRPPAKRMTIGEVATARLDDLRNLAIGKVAPDFEGIGADGKPIKLSDHRGKVVVLVYWFSGCGPCLSEIPHDRELAARMKGRPLSLLGVVTDDKADDARKVIDSEKMTWPIMVSGGDKVAELYHVKSNPDYFVLDAAGVIRAKGYRAVSQIDELVGKLVAEAEAKQPTP